MDSPTSTQLTRPTAPRGREPLADGRRGRPRSKHARPRATLGWPVRTAERVALRILLGLPFAGLALRAYGDHFADNANTILARHAGEIAWGSSNLSFVGHVYPPLPTVVAALLPSSTALGVAGSLGAGAMLEVIGARLYRRGYPLWAVLTLIACFGASPGFALTATTNLSAFMALTFVALALEGFLKFAFHGYTHAGFSAGLMIGIATLCDPIAVVFAVGFAVSAPLIAHRRYRGSPAAGRATAAVLLFPTVAGLAGWTFLCWRFSSSPLVWLHSAAPAIWDRQPLGAGLHAVLLTLVLTPVFVLAVALLAAHDHPVSALGLCVPLVCVLIGVVIGLPCPPATVAVVLGVVGMTSLPRRPTRTVLLIIAAVAIAGLAAKWSYPPSSDLENWLHAIRTA